MLSVIVSDFIRDIEQRLEEDEDKYMRCVCLQPFANAPLKCSRKLCPSCYEKLDTCPLCRVKFKDDVLIFANFDACIFRHPAQPVTYVVYTHGGKTRDSLLLAETLINVLAQLGVTFSLGVSRTGGNVKFYEISDAEPVAEAIRTHTRLVNLLTNNPVRRALVDEGIQDEDCFETCLL